MKLYKKKLFFVIMIFLLLESLFMIGIYFSQKSDINEYLQRDVYNLQTDTKMVIMNLNERSDIFYHLLIDKPEMKEIICAAAHTNDEARRAELRQKLAAMYAKTYEYLKEKGVRQFHFHLPGAISFLRFHKPEKYGDCLIGIRESLEYVNKYKKPIQCYEEGRIFNGFRNVYPIFNGKHFVGTVEISYSFRALQNEFLKVDNSSYLFITNTKVAMKKLFASEKFHYKTSEFSGFDYDKATLRKNMSFSLETIYKINSQLANTVDARLKKGEMFAVLFQDKNIYKNKIIVVGFIPVPNLKGKVVAYIINYKFADYIAILQKKYMILYITMSLIAFLISILICVVLYYEEQKHKQIEFLATHDALTSIYNRLGLDNLLKHKIAESKRYKEPLSVIFFDIDFFKRVNDTYGHDIGDNVLKNIAEIVTKNIRNVDIFARWGGEEFIIFLPNTKLQDAVKVAQKLRKAIEEHTFYKAGRVTCSFGVTALKENDTKETFIKRADEFLYEAKQRGRNRVMSDVDIGE